MADQKSNVFDYEKKILEKAENALKKDPMPEDELLNHYKELVCEYKKLLNKTQKITVVGDSNQKKLFTACDKIESQNLQLNQAVKEAEEARFAKSEFFARMSHELRNPMNVILGMTELALITAIDKEQRDYLETLKHSGQRLLHIINDILDFSKLDAHQLTLERIDFFLRDRLHSLIKMMTVSAAHKGLALNFRIGKGVPQVLKGDYPRLEQILVNLVGNAIKFTNRGGITIDVSLANVAEEKREDRIPLLFSVRDTGMGIPVNYHETIFNSFNQGNVSITRKHGGTGLGLAICKQLVELMGGQIYVDSKPGKGSSFFFTVQLEPGNYSRAKSNKQQNYIPRFHGKPLRIFLAEDSAINAKLIIIFLKKLNHRVFHDYNGKDLLRRLKKQQADLILMDIEMPGLDGFETLRLIREDVSGAFDSNIPVIALTAHTQQDFKDKIFKCGFNDYIPKPIDLYRLSRILLFHGPGKPVQPSGNAPWNVKKRLNIQEALKRLNDDIELFQKFCRMFIDEIPEINHKLDKAFLTKNFDDLKNCAHYLKGSAATIGADRVSHISYRLEQVSGDSDSPENPLELIHAIRQEMEKLKTLILPILKKI